LNSTGVNVANVVRYNPADVGQNLAGVTLAPDKLKPGDAVSLVVNDNNQVLYYTRSSPDVALLHTQVQANQQQLQQTNASLKEIAASSLQTRVTTLEAQVASQLTATSQQLKDSLEAANKTLSTSQPTLDATKDLQARVDSLRAELASQKTAHDQALAERDQKIVELTKNTQALQKQLQLITTRLPGGPGGLK